MACLIILHVYGFDYFGSLLVVLCFCGHYIVFFVLFLIFYFISYLFGCSSCFAIGVNWVSLLFIVRFLSLFIARCTLIFFVMASSRKSAVPLVLKGKTPVINPSFSPHYTRSVKRKLFSSPSDCSASPDINFSQAVFQQMLDLNKKFSLLERFIKSSTNDLSHRISNLEQCFQSPSQPLVCSSHSYFFL